MGRDEISPRPFLFMLGVLPASTAPTRSPALRTRIAFAARTMIVPHSVQGGAPVSCAASSPNGSTPTTGQEAGLCGVRIGFCVLGFFDVAVVAVGMKTQIEPAENVVHQTLGNRDVFVVGVATAEFLYLTSAMSGSMPVVSQSVLFIGEGVQFVKTDLYHPLYITLRIVAMICVEEQT